MPIKEKGRLARKNSLVENRLKGLSLGGNENTERHPAGFGQVKLEALFSHVNEAKS